MTVNVNCLGALGLEGHEPKYYSFITLIALYSHA